MSFQIKTLKSEREDALKHRDRLSIMREEKDAFLSKLKEARMSVYKVGMLLNYRKNINALVTLNVCVNVNIKLTLTHRMGSDHWRIVKIWRWRWQVWTNLKDYMKELIHWHLYYGSIQKAGILWNYVNVTKSCLVLRTLRGGRNWARFCRFFITKVYLYYSLASQAA